MTIGEKEKKIKDNEQDVTHGASVGSYLVPRRGLDYLLQLVPFSHERMQVSCRGKGSHLHNTMVGDRYGRFQKLRGLLQKMVEE